MTKDKSNKGQQRREAMGKDSIWKLMVRFSSPAIISMMAASSYNLIDAVFLGRLGPTTLAAMSVTFPLVLSFIAIASGTAVGVTSLIARSLGAGDDENADRTAGTAIALGFILGVIILLVCLPVLDGILRSLGADGEVLSLARSYMAVIIIFSIFSYLSMMFASIIRADGNPVFSSLVSISAALLNIALDPVFIFGFGFIPTMGIKGAAVATVISQAAGTCIFAFHIISGKTAYKFRPAYFIPRLKIIIDIYRVGTASIVRSGAQFAVMGVINNTAASFGVIPLAVIGVLIRAGRFIQMPILGLGQGIMPVISYNYGAEKQRRVAETAFKIMVTGSVWTFLCWLAVMLFPAQIMSVFSSESDFLREGAQAVRLFSLAYFTLGLRMVPGFFFQGIGKGFPVMLLTLIQNIVFLLLPILILPKYLGLTGLWISFPVSDILALAFGQVWMNIVLRQKGISLFWWKMKDDFSANHENV